MKRRLEAATVGPFSAAIVSDGICYVSAQGGLDPVTGDVVPGGIRAETRQRWKTSPPFSLPAE